MTATMAIARGDLVVREVRVKARDGMSAGDLTWEVLRQVPFTGMRKAVLGEPGHVGYETTNEPGAMTADEVVRGILQLDRVERRRSQVSLPDTDLARVAEAYVEAVAADPRRSNVVLADRLGLTTRTATRLVHKAREKGLLTKPASPRGKAGGQLTNEARRILAVSA